MPQSEEMCATAGEDRRLAELGPWARLPNPSRPMVPSWWRLRWSVLSSKRLSGAERKVGVLEVKLFSFVSKGKTTTVLQRGPARRGHSISWGLAGYLNAPAAARISGVSGRTSASCPSSLMVGH